MYAGIWVKSQNNYFIYPAILKAAEITLFFRNIFKSHKMCNYGVSHTVSEPPQIQRHLKDLWNLLLSLIKRELLLTTMKNKLLEKYYTVRIMIRLLLSSRLIMVNNVCSIVLSHCLGSLRDSVLNTEAEVDKTLNDTFKCLRYKKV